ncbi:MAG: permease [Clostridia bacterium]|nr:permease [Clostridia bacterium]
MPQLNEISQQLLTILLIAAIGYPLGRLPICGVELGPSALFIVALFFGHFGADLPVLFQSVGLLLFMAAVGLSAGPTFFARLRENGVKYILLCLATALTGSLLVIGIVRLMGIPTATVLGVMTGAFTTSPGFAAAKETFAADPQAVAMLAAGYGLIYPVGVLCKVLFVQLVPKWLHADIAAERERIAIPEKTDAPADSTRGRIEIDHLGMFPFCLAMGLGILIGAIKIPLPGGGAFSLGITGGPLLCGLLLGHLKHVGPLSLRPRKGLLEAAKQIGLMFFFSSAGVEGGRKIVSVLMEYGWQLLIFGVILVVVPLAVGFFLFHRVLKLPLLNGLAAVTASMTCTASLAALIETAKSDDVATTFATVYPLALVELVLVTQFLALL